MNRYQLEWFEDADGWRRQPGWWTRLIAPIITAILVVALGMTVFGLMAPDDSSDVSSQPTAVESAD